MIEKKAVRLKITKDSFSTISGESWKLNPDTLLLYLTSAT